VDKKKRIGPYGSMFKVDKKLIQRALEIHEEALVADQHSDIQMDIVTRRGRGEARVIERIHLPKMIKGGVDFTAVSTPPRYNYQPHPYFSTAAHCALQMIDCICMEIAENPDQLALVHSAAEIQEAKKDGKRSFMLCMEGAEALDTDLSLLRNFYRLGVRIIELTWHQKNLVADGCGEPSNSGLSNFGRELVREMNRIGMVIDLSHISEAGFWDVISLSQSPVIASHSNARSVCDHPRNLWDDQIKALAKKGGVMGMNFLGQFVKDQNPTVEDILNHIDHIANLVGVEHVGLGPDWIDYAPQLILDCLNPRDYLSKRIPITIYAKGLEREEELPNLTIGLLARGYSERNIRNILGRNFLRSLDTAQTPISQETLPRSCRNGHG
jgi:membrane dipeptidase